MAHYGKLVSALDLVKSLESSIRIPCNLDYGYTT